MADKTELKLNFTLKELTLSCPNEDVHVPGSSSNVELRDNKLVCVEYPAVISSVDKMLQTLGGEQTVSKTFAHPNRRLELRYRPQDPFSHSLCGNRFLSSNLLLRVRRRVRKKDPRDAEIHMDILGVIGTTYKFQGLADFQCLAVQSENGKDTSLYDKIILRKSENQEFFEQPMPYFLPPAIFSRLDNPVDYFYRADVSQKSGQESLNKKSFICLNRARRPHNAIFISFTDPTVPTECLEAARNNWARVCLKDSDKEVEEQLKKMFESRPIWSRNAVKANINIHPDKLKMLLPVVAYYMVTGPWRSLWVRLGYDPRKTKESKKYQMLDFRIRCSTKHGYSLSDMPVKAKRSALSYNLPIIFNKAGEWVYALRYMSYYHNGQESRADILTCYLLSLVINAMKIAVCSSCFEMYCSSLCVSSIKQVIEQNSGNEQACDERDGWCAVGTTDKLRDIISAMIKKLIRAQKPALPEIPKKRSRRKGPHLKSSAREMDVDEEEDDDDENEEDEDDEFQPSEGSENEMETEILDYM
uniref:General transcription factor IIIC, polypeptide 5 n=1 Tax=Mastacembelus armatus TaxID=205130 RepID=A0A7N8Y0V7_9TELE